MRVARDMLNRKRRPAETLVDHIRRVSRVGRRVLTHLRVLAIPQLALEGWRGWAVRVARPPADRPIHRILKWRPLRWWRGAQVLGGGEPPTGCPRAVRPGAKVRWEGRMEQLE
eukprot:4330051-Lingulodinium_polyedra.AAC.1